MPKKLFLITLAVAMWASSLWAQNINVISVDSSYWPEVRLVGVLPDGKNNPEDYTLQMGVNGPSVTASRLNGPLRNDPASMVLAIDTSRSLSPAQLHAAQQALGRYLDRLDSGEEVALLGFNDTVQLATGFTGNREEVKRNLNSLELDGTKTELYRSLLYGIELLKNTPGRHHLLVISDGHDEGSSVTKEQVLQRALENNIKISAVGIPGTEATGSGQHLPIMQDMAAQTGGSYLEAHSADELNTGLYGLLERHQAQARNERDRLYELTFVIPGAAPRTALPASLRYTVSGADRMSTFHLPAPPADMVALASSALMANSAAGSQVDDGDESQMAVSAEKAAASAVASSGGSSAAPVTGGGAGGGGLTAANTVNGSLASPSAMTAPAAAAVSASSVPAPVSGSTSFWRSPALWLLLAFLLLALGLYYWWQSQKEEEYELEGIEESINPDLENDDREPSVDVERAFIFDPGPVTAPLGGVGLSRPVSPFSLVFPATSRKIPLRQGVVTIGSSPDSSIVLEEMEVSPNHAEIYVMDGECDIRITAPGNEVKVNGRPLSTTRTALKPGDEVRIGRTLAVLWRNEPVDRQNYKKYQRKTQRG